MIVEANVWAGSWYGLQVPGCESASLNAVVTVSASGTAKLVLSEGKAGAIVKTTVTAKALNADGKTATLEVVKNKAVLRSFVVDFENGTLNSDGTRLMDLCEPTAATEETDVTTFVLEEVADGATNAYAYVTATYNAKKALFAFAGKLWDGTAVKGTTYALDRATSSGGHLLAPVLLADKAKNAIYLELSDDGSWCRVLENGTPVSVGADGTTPWSACAAAAALKGTALSQLAPGAREGVILTDGVATVVPLTDREKLARLAASGLVKLTLGAEDGWTWTCELIPVDADGETQFRGIATGKRIGCPSQACAVFVR